MELIGLFYSTRPLPLGSQSVFSFLVIAFELRFFLRETHIIKFVRNPKSTSPTCTFPIFFVHISFTPSILVKINIKGT